METEIPRIFSESQFSTASHQKLADALYRLFQKSVVEEFFVVFKRKALNHLLCCEYKPPNVNGQKAVQFLASFLAKVEGFSENEENEAFLKSVFDYLFAAQCADDHVVRYRSCEIFCTFFDKLAGNAISEELFTKIQETLLCRMRDSKTEIRLLAIRALHRLQNPADPNDPVVQEFLASLRDPKATVRRLAVEKVALRRDVLDQIVLHTRDVDAAVRLAAFRRLSKLPRALKILQRQRIVKSGFCDENEKVRRYVGSTLAAAWFEEYGCDYLELVMALRLDGDEEDVLNTVRCAELVLRAVFSTQTLMSAINALPFEDDTIPFEKLNWETILFWRILVQQVRKCGYSDEKFVPDLVTFCEYIENYCKWKPKPETCLELLEQQFVIEQLLIISEDYDLTDIVCRNTLRECVRTLLQTVDIGTRAVNIAVRILEQCVPNVECRCRYVSEIISEIISPTDEDAQKQFEEELAALERQLEAVTIQKTICVNAKEYLKAGEHQKEQEALELAIKSHKEGADKQKEAVVKTDSNTINKYLDIAAALLSSAQITVLIPTLISLKEEVIQGCLIHSCSNIKAKALKCYVLCCLIDRTTAKTGIHICSIPILAYHQDKEYEVPLLSVAIGGVVDMFLIYGFNLLAEPDTENISDSVSEQHRTVFTGGTSLTTIIQGLVDLMDDENPKISSTAAKGLCALVTFSNLESPSLITRLILKWANPANDTESESEIKCYIAYTLAELIQHEHGTRQFKKAVLSTIKALIRAPEDSPLYDVQGSVINFLAAMCSNAVNGLEMQAQLANTICDFIKDDPKSVFNLAYVKFLLLLDLPKNREFIEDLMDDCEVLLDAVRNKNVLNSIRKFKTKLYKLVSKTVEIKTEHSSVKQEKNEESDDNDDSNESEDD